MSFPNPFSMLNNSTLNYWLGLLLSLGLLVPLFFFLEWRVLSISLPLTLIQIGIHSFFFFHLGKEAPPRWNLLFLILTALILGIIVLGSLWIMNHIAYNEMPA